ncbi:hypothetical protein LCGC14_0957580 [marine sediment metagenome]|uniref:HD/PDEase domain-containing protein n=1 Tax=marine sediment metagenome TaxID=412755 RepID=A0A0F9NK58_9ZZZZ
MNNTWIMTASGRCVYPLELRPEDVVIGDIAHGLAHTCRFNGHSTNFYSVAEHSLIMSHKVSSEAALYALLHDAPEIYISDVPSPIKTAIPQIKEIEERIWQIIMEKFGLNRKHRKEVELADRRMLCTERKQIMPLNNIEFDNCHKVKPYVMGPAYKDGVTIQCLAPQGAKRLFLERFLKLTKRVL